MKKKTIFSSLLTIILCLSLIAGSTYALFTSEDKVNIAVSSATVKLDASITNVQTWSLEDDKAAAGRNDGTFSNGGSAKIANDGSFNIALMTPGDKVSFDIVGANTSNVLTQYRYIIECVGDTKPMEVLDVTINGDLYKELVSYTSAWATLDALTAMPTVKVSIEMPVETIDEYQNFSTSFKVTVEAVQGNADKTDKEEVKFLPDKWDGTTFDTSWYNPEDTATTKYTLDSAEQVAGLITLVDGGDTFEGKTIELASDMDLQNKLFEPIGSYREDTPFMGTFDGQGHTILNMSQNTWELDNGYYYGDLGLGFFGKVENATIKNLNFDGAEISGESAICGVVAATAYGDCTFENITVKNAKCADYQYYAGGIVGWASGNHQYINCTVDASTQIAAQWGDFDNSIGGIIGGAGGSAEIFLKDCTVACRIDAYNDVTSSYQWYAYRRAGMLIGNTGKTKTVGETTYADAPQLTCENVTVIYGDWANYTYCEFAGQNWPYVRVQAGVSNSAYSNPRYGHPTDANGNEVVDDNHVHNEGEDHHILCVFDQLYGGGQGVYGTAAHPGVTVIYNNKPAANN